MLMSVIVVFLKDVSKCPTPLFSCQCLILSYSCHDDKAVFVLLLNADVSVCPIA